MSSTVSSIFGRPKRPKVQAPEPEPEPVVMVEEEAREARRRERKKLLTGGRRATILSGILNALKKRLGE